MRTADQGVRWQFRQLAQGIRHLCRGAFKETSATSSKQGITTENKGLFYLILTKVRNVSGGVAGDVQDVQRQFQSR